jgi:hypothetical protein
MWMSKQANETKTAAISADAFDEPATTRLMAAMEAFMAADFVEEIATAALIQRAA